MKRINLFRWGSFVLMIGAIAARPLFEHAYRTDRDKGWTTYFPNAWAHCNIGGMDIVIDGLRRIWLFGGGDCDFFDTGHVFDGRSWEAPRIDQTYDDTYAFDGHSQLWRLRQPMKGGRVTSGEIGAFDYDHELWRTRLVIDSDSLDEPSDVDVQGFAIDRQGRVWMTSLRRPLEQDSWLWTTSVSVFDGQRWETYDADNTAFLALGVVGGPVFDSQDQAWFWNESGKLMLMDPKGGTSFPYAEPSLEGFDEAWSLSFDTTGNPWVGTRNGLLISLASGQVLDIQEACPNGSVGDGGLHTAFDDSNRVWVACESAQLGGLTPSVAVFDGTSWTVFTADNSGLPEGFVLDLDTDQTGDVWILTSTGISVLDSDVVERPVPPSARLWTWLGSDELVLFGNYSLIPLFLFLLWLYLLFPRGYRLSAIGSLLGILALAPILLAILGILLTGSGSGGSLVCAPPLMTSLGILGLLACSIALSPLGKQDKKHRRLAVIGLVLSALGSALGLLAAWG